MEKTGRTVSFLWLALALVALTGTIVFSVFAGISAGASGKSFSSPVTLEAGAGKSGGRFRLCGCFGQSGRREVL